MSTPVLFVDHASALGGAEYSLLLLFESLDRRQFIPHLASQPGLLAESARAVGVVVHEVPLLRLRGELAAVPRVGRGIAALAKIIRREAVHLVYSNTVRASIYAAPAAKLTRRAHLWHVHDILTPGAYARVMSAFSNAVICVSEAAMAPLLRGRKKTHVIPNGVRISAFAADRGEEASRLRTMWGVPDDAVLIGQVARLAPWKGQRDVIAAADLLLQEHPDVYVAIVGGDIFADSATYAAGLRETVQTTGLSHRVLFTGHMTDVAAVLTALDVVVLASDREPFGRVLIEAGAAGRPVVSYASGGVPEIVIDGQTGILVPPGNRSALAAALARLVNDHALRCTLGANAREHVARHFEISAITRHTEAVMLEAMRRSRTPPVRLC